MNFDLHLTTDCNMQCSFCGAWEFGNELKYLELERAKEALGEAKKAGYRIVTFTGGEPSLSPHFTELIDFAHKLGFWSVVTTNGVNLTDEILECYQRCHTLVRISLHTLKGKLHKEITGTDTLELVIDNIRKLHKKYITIGVGCTVYEENICEVEDIARFAWEEGASFVRYTPVVGIRGAKNIILTAQFYEKLLEMIFDLCVANHEILDYRTSNRYMDDSRLYYMLTRQCAGGSKQHIIHDSHGKVIPCSFILEEMGLCCNQDRPVKTQFNYVYDKMNELRMKLSEKLEGECNKCNYRDVCLGGCFTTKLSFGLKMWEEQPICILKIVINLLNKYHEKEQEVLKDYWLSSFIKKTTNEEKNKYCMRRLPIWEITYRRDYMDNKYRFRETTND